MKKKTYFVFRLGLPEILSIDQIALGQISYNDNDLVGASLPFGLLSLINTDLSADEIVDRYKSAAGELHDHAPVIVWAFDDPNSGMDLSDYTNVSDMISDFIEMHDLDTPTKNDIETTPLDLDSILDKISREGMDSLTASELSHLKNASNQ